MLMMAGVGGAFLTGDIFNLYVWFEVFVISSFGLLVVGTDERRIDGAVKYAILNLVATTLFLIATGYLYGVFGTLNMADLHRKVAAAGAAAPMMTLATLYLVAFGMKAAAFPVNFWLPASYHTPKIVTSALFGGLLTKVGIYGLLRVLVMIMPAERMVLSGLIGWIAIATMIVGVVCALAQTDIRRMLGFALISGIGVMLAGLALGDAAGVSGAILYAVHSMLVMTALYLAVGNDPRRRRQLFARRSRRPLRPGAAARRLGTAACLRHRRAAARVRTLAEDRTGQSLARRRPRLDRRGDPGERLVDDGGLRPRLPAGLLAHASPSPGLLSTKGRAPAIAYAALAILVLGSLAIGLYPGAVHRRGDGAAAGLIEPSHYVDAVFPGALQ